MKKHSLLLILCFLCASYLSTNLYAQCPSTNGLTNLAVSEPVTSATGGTLNFTSGNGNVCNGKPPGFEIYVQIDDGPCVAFVDQPATDISVVVPPGGTYTVTAYHPLNNGNPNICFGEFEANPPCMLTAASCTDPCAPFDATACACVEITTTKQCPNSLPNCAGVTNPGPEVLTCEDCPIIPPPANPVEILCESEPNCLGLTNTVPSTCGVCPVVAPPVDPETMICESTPNCLGEVNTAPSVCGVCPLIAPPAEPAEMICESAPNCRGEVNIGLSICGVCPTIAPPADPVDFLCFSDVSCSGAFNTAMSVCGVCPPIETPPCPPKCPTTCPPCSIQDPFTCECTPNPTVNECIPYSCDDGDPCTSGDVEERNCDGSICVPCAGKFQEIESIEVVNMRDCDNKGNADPSDDTFKGDIVVTFNYSRVIEDFIITGDAYFSYKESYCVVNDNTITIENRTFKANGDRITLHGILNGRLSCSYTKNGLGGQALGPCMPMPMPMPNMPGSDRVTHFNAFQQDRQVDLEWLMNQSDQSEAYVIERSIGGDFEVIAEIENTEFTNEERYFNSFDEMPVLGDNHYRLKQVFKDGHVEYSAVQTVNFGVNLDAISFFPNPAQSELFIDLNEYAGKTGHMVINNQLGQVVQDIDFDEIPQDLIKLDLTNYANGLYFIRVKVDNSKYVAKKILVSKFR